MGLKHTELQIMGEGHCHLILETAEPKVKKNKTTWMLLQSNQYSLDWLSQNLLQDVFR